MRTPNFWNEVETDGNLMKIARKIMKTTSKNNLNNESGFAMITALLLMVVMISLVPAAIQLSSGEMKRTNSFTEERKAFFVAEAGLEHAKFLVEQTSLRATLAGPDDLVSTTPSDTENDDNGTFNVGTPVTRPDGNIYDEVAFNGNTYYIRAYDNDDGDSDLTTDSDNLVMLSAVGVVNGNTTTVQAMVYKLPGSPENAVAINGDMDVSGNPSISGTCGSIHANDDLDISGSPNVSENATASGTYAGGSETVGGTSGGGHAEVPIPLLDPTEFEQYADYVLAADGNVYDSNGTFIHDANSSKWNGWDFSSPKWTMSKNTTIDGSFYVEGDIVISGNAGSSGNPWELTLVATGHIEVSGTPVFENKKNPADPEEIQNLFMVAGTDLKVNGNADQHIEGLFYATEQFYISGNPDINGAVMAYDAPSVDGLLSENNISGNASITYGCGMSIPGVSNDIRVISWNQDI